MESLGNEKNYFHPFFYIILYLLLIYLNAVSSPQPYQLPVIIADIFSNSVIIAGILDNRINRIKTE